MDNTKVADLTVDEIKRILRETVAQTLAELLSDPDEGLDLRDKLNDELLAALKEPQMQYKLAETIAEKLDMNW